MAREMKDSGIEWIGEIPKEWKTAKMNNVCTVITDYVASGSFASLAENVQYLDEPDYAMLIRTMDISNKGYSGKPVYINEHAYNFLSNSNLFGGEIILPNIGASVGDVYIVPKLYERMSLAPNSIMIRTAECDKYIYYFFYCDAGKMSVIDIAQSTAQPKFNKTDFRQLKISLPPLPEQEKIASFLDSECARIDEVISKTKSTIEEYKKLKQSVITEAVTKGIRPNREMKDSSIEWIGEIPREWNVVKIGTQYTERKTKVSDTDYPPLSVTMKGILPQLATAAKSDAHDDRKLVCKGDFAINSRSDRRGSCGISPYDGSVSLINTILKSRDEMNPIYYDWLFHSTMFSDEFYKWGHGIVNDLWTTNWQDMKKISIPEPPINEQEEIANYIDKKCTEIDTLIAKKEQIITELESYKKSLIYEYVTGKKEVV